MPDINDQDYLLNNQYRDAANLDARVRLHQMYSTNPYNWHRWCFDQLDLPPDARVLELGCGPGYLWRENPDRIPPGGDHLSLGFFSRDARSSPRQSGGPRLQFRTHRRAGDSV